MARNDQAVRLLVVLKQLEGARHGLTLEQLAAFPIITYESGYIHAHSGATWPRWKRPGIRWSPSGSMATPAGGCSKDSAMFPACAFHHRS